MSSDNGICELCGRPTLPYGTDKGKGEWMPGRWRLVIRCIGCEREPAECTCEVLRG